MSVKVVYLSPKKTGLHAPPALSGVLNTPQGEEAFSFVERRSSRSNLSETEDANRRMQGPLVHALHGE
ncbi:MAG: hypothetical protein ABI343_21330 [Burkholderiaceae bacterium]